MCGIAGIITENISYQQVDSIISNALQAMNYRGPDQTGQITGQQNDIVFGLGHLRLSIIDLSVSGQQPFMSDNGRYALTYNGEVYNFITWYGWLTSVTIKKAS